MRCLSNIHVGMSSTVLETGDWGSRGKLLIEHAHFWITDIEERISLHKESINREKAEDILGGTQPFEFWKRRVHQQRRGKRMSKENEMFWIS